MKEILKLVNVSKSFGKKKVIKNISITLEPGTVVGFLGPNGAGKSVTIKMIVGFLKQDSGEILINGYSTTKNYERAIKNVGAIVENPDLFEYLSGYDNIEMIARVYNKKKGKINEIVKLLGLQDRIHDKVKNYSLGMKQRLGICLALIREPNLLILDEPTNGLDPSGIHELRDIIRKLAHEQNITVFVSSHLLSEMELMCDSVVVINNGQVIRQDSMENIKKMRNDDKNTQYFLVTNINTKASEILKSYGYSIASISDDKIYLNIAKEKITDMVELLKNSGILVFEIAREKNTLENLFLNLTEGEKSNENV